MKNTLTSRKPSVWLVAVKSLLLPKFVTNTCKSVLSLLLFLAVFQSGHAQSINDFRSKANGNWNATATWERYDGAAWVAATYYPGFGTTNAVSVLHTVTGNYSTSVTGLSVSGALTMSAGITMVVNGNLSVTAGTYTLNSGALTVNGSVAVSGGTLSGSSGAITVSGGVSVSAGAFALGSGAFTVNTVAVSAGTLSINSGAFTVSGATTISGGLLTDISNTGVTTFGGLVTVSGSGAITTTSVSTSSNMVLLNGLSQQGVGTISFGALSFNTNVQEVSLADNTGNITFSGAVVANTNLTIKNTGVGMGVGGFTFNSTFTIANDITVTNNRSVVMVGTLNGSNAASTWVNAPNTSLDYQSAAMPMATGVLNATAVGNTVNYVLNNTQTIKITDYYHLNTNVTSGTTFRSKQLETTNASFTVLGDLTVGAYTTLLYSSADAIQTLTIKGRLVNHGTVNLRWSATRYCDLIFDGAGDVLTGTSSTTMLLRNLMFNNAGAKTITYTGGIELRTGAGVNVFVNNGGALTVTSGAVRLIDAFEINGSGAITFNDLQCGSNNQTIQTLNRDVTVNGVMTLWHSNTLSSYFNINGYTLTLLGDVIRVGNGEFGGTAGSNLIVGSGNTPTFTNNIMFETGVQTLNNLTLNVSNTATLGSPLAISNLLISAGTLTTALDITIGNTFVNNGNYNQTASTTIFSKPAGVIDIAGNGTHSFSSITIADGSVTTSKDISLLLNFTNSSNAASSFLATAGTVFFTSNSTQSLLGTGLGTVVFNNLSFNTISSNRTKYLATNFSVTGTMQINNGAYVYFDNAAARSVTVNNLIVGGGASGQLLVNTTGAANHQLTIQGALTVNAGATLNLRNAVTRYADVTFTGAGTVLQGTGNFYFHSILLNNVAAKSFNTASPVYLYAASNTPNSFTNDGGAFSTAIGSLVFRDNLTDWTLGGTGAITLAMLQVGVNTTTNVKLTRDITVLSNLQFYQSSSAYYLDLNGYTLTLNGNHTRQSNGRIRGGGTSKMIINGTGNFTSTFAFDQTTLGTTNRLAQLDYNRLADGNMVLATLMEVDVLNLQQGIINASAGSIQVNSQANLLAGSFIDNNNTGTNTFNGALTISAGATFNPSSSSILSLSGTITNNGVFNKDGAGATVFTGNCTLNGTVEYYFLNGNITVNDGVVVNNQSAVNDIGVSVVGLINGAGAGAQWLNNGVLTYVSATAPMVIGSLNATPIGNKVYYSRTQNVQSIKNTTYHHVIFDGGSTRTLLGDMTVNGDLTIGAETILYTSDFQITGNATGLLTMGESSELRIGRTNVQSAAVFPTGFVRANMVFDPISLVTYNGVAQLLSHEPVYSNLAITSGGNKTITGDVTVNGYLNITTGNLVYGSTVAQNVTINGDLYASGGTFNMSGGGLAHVLDLYGGINQVNRFTAALNSRVRYMSTDAQQVFSPTSGDYYGKFEVQGGSVKFLELDTEIRGELIMTSGIIRLGDKNLTLNTNSAAVLPITGACSSSNMIETNGLGKLIRKGIGASPYNYLLGLYPIGSEGKYSPVTLTSIAGGSSNRSFQVRALAERHPNVPATYDALLRYYDIVTDVTTPTAVANFAFDALDVIGDVAKYKAYSWNGTSFVNPATSSIVGTSIVFSPATSVPLQVTAYDNVTVRRTLYAYKDGPWDDPDTWTTDPSGQNLEGASVPVSSDNVVILPSRTIHLLNNVTVSGLIITINGGGILDLRDKGFTQTVSIIQGEGTMRMASNQMPPASLNSLVKPGGGTVEYNVADASFILNSQAVYNNLTINLTNASNKAVLMNSLTVHGNLLIDKGDLQLYKDDATATVYNPIILDVKKDLVVSVNGKITTGTASTTLGNLPPSGTTPGSLVTRYYDAYHKVYIGGSLYNTGSVKFISSDITTIDFANLTTRGAATVRFYGIDNATLDCSGTTDFYNLVVDKGSGVSAELNLDASAVSNFRLFGANSFAASTGGVNPELRKALWIRNGTLRLTGSTTIPTLSEGYIVGVNSSYIIPAFGALVLDGPNVTVLTTADSPNEVTAAWGVSCAGVNALNFTQDFYVYGRLAVNDGFLSTRFSSGIVFPQLSGELILGGGKISTRQVRTTTAGTTSYLQTGGELELIGGYTYNTSGIIANVSDIRNVPIVYTHNGNRIGSNGSFDWSSSANAFNMTGGTINVYNTSGGSGSAALRILSDASNISCTGGQINVHISRNTPYDLRVPNGALPNLTINKSSGTGTARLLDKLAVNGDLILNGITELYANSSSFGLSVAGNFNIGATAIYNPNQNTTRFYGSTNSIFTVGGSIVSDLFSLQIEKSAATVSLAGANANIKVRGDLTLTSGTLDDNGFTITAKGNVLNSGVHSGTGKVVLAEGAVNRTVGGSGLGVWGNLEVNEAGGIISSLTANQSVLGTFTLTAGIMDLSKYSLTLEGALMPNTLASYSDTRMFRTDGNPSDGGLIRKITANGSWIYPIGTDNGFARLTSTDVTVTGYVSSGYLQINPVAAVLPLLNQLSTEPALNYYWRVRQTGFSVLPQVSYLFKYNDADLQSIGDDAVYVPGKVVGATRSKLPSGVNTVAKTITYTPAEALATASYTAAHTDRFDGVVPVFYSRVCGVAESAWSNVNTWSEVSHTGAVASRVPAAGDIVYIGSGGGCNYNGGGDYHNVVVDVDVTVGELNFSPVLPGVFLPRLIFPQDRIAGFDKISGAGIIVQRVTPTLAPTITADWGEFLAQPTSQLIYELQSAGTVIQPVITTSYPNLKIEAKGDVTGNRYLVLDADLQIRGNLIVDKGASLLMNDGATGNITVAGTTQIGGEEFGRILFMGDGNPRVFTSKDITLVNTGLGASNQLAVQTSPAAGLTHTVSVSGNLVQNNGTIDLFTNNTGGSNANLVFTGTSNTSFTTTAGTTPDLYRLTVNKGTSQTALLTVNTNILLGAPTDIATKPIVLTNGSLVLNNAAINVVLSSGGGLFPIPATAALVISNGKVSINTDVNGIDLQGKLRVDNTGICSLGDGTSNIRIVIQYKGLTPVLEIADNGLLEVNSQIRRLTNSISGSLKYRQTGGQVLIHGQYWSYGRARLEVLNTGSEFTMSGGTITIRRGGGTTFGDLYLTPSTSSVTGGEIIFSQGTLNTTQTYTMNSSIALPKLTIGGNTINNRTATLTLMTLPLQVNQTMLFSNALARFSTNNRNVTLLGDLNFQGLWTSGTTDITTFSGGTQTITGSPTMMNVKVNSSTSLTMQPASVLTVNGTLEVNSPQFVDGGNAIIAKQNVVNNGAFINSTPLVSTSGLKLRGGVTQKLSGTGTFGLMELDNISGASLLNNVSLSNNLTLTRGLFNIGSQLLTLGTSATIVPGTAFSSSNMILTDGVLGTSGGVIKSIPAGASSFLFPIGSSSKYTPVLLTTTSNAAAGTVLVKPVNQVHPTVGTNVLKYYWVVESTGLTAYNGSLVFNYLDGDVVGTEASYIGARLVGIDWAKFTDVVDAAANTITIPFAGVSDIKGEYTAGLDADIPDQVPLFQTIASGNWTDEAIWERVGGGSVPVGGPLGHRVLIQTGHTVTMSSNSRRVYTTTIDGRLEILATYGHNLGVVDGVGTLALSTNQLPAGKFDAFFSCTGGTMEYGGAVSYTISDRYLTFKNLNIVGSGVKTLPNAAITVCGDVTVSSGTLKLSHFSLGVAIKNTTINGNLIVAATGALDTDINEYVYVKGNISNAGTANFKNEYIGQRFILNGSTPQSIAGNFAAINQRFYDLQLLNTQGYQFSDDVEVVNYCYNTTGLMTMLNNKTVKVSKYDGLVSAPSATNYVVGLLSRKMDSGSANSTFGVGKGGKLKTVALTTRSVAGSYWSAEFFNQSPLLGGYDPDVMDASVSIVSNDEYFMIKGPNAASTKITLPLTGTNNLVSITSDLTLLRIARWDGAKWVAVGGTVVVTGTKTAGTITTQNTVTCNGANQYYAIATTQPRWQWTGAVDNNWFTGGNWFGGSKPIATSLVVIPATANNPVINTSEVAVCDGVNISTGATLTLNAGGRFVANGNITGPANSLIIKNTSASPASFINYGTVAQSVQIEWIYVNALQFWYIGHAVNGAVASNYGVLSGASRDVAIYKWPSNWTGNTIVADATPLNETLMGYVMYFKNPNTNVVTRGALNTGNITRTPLTNAWHLMSNPYPAYIDLDKTTEWDFGQALLSTWITTDITPGVRGFATYNVTLGIGANGGQGYIAPGQSFWIRTYTANDWFTIKAGARNEAGTGVLKSGKTSTNDVLRMTMGNGVSKDEMVMAFKGIGRDEFGVTDSEKRMQIDANYPQVYSLKGGSQVAISTLPTQIDGREIALGYLPVANEKVTIAATNIEAFMPDVSVELEDKETNTFYDLRVTPQVTVSVKGTTANDDRFVLYFSRVAGASTNVTDQVDDTKAQDGIVITANNGRLKVKVKNTDYQKSVDVKLYSVSGEGLLNDTFVGDSKEYDLPTRAGHYVVRVNAANAKGAKLNKRVVIPVKK